MNQARFLVTANEALGLSYKEVLDSSYSLIEVMLREYSYIMGERYKTKDENGEVEGRDYEWVELPSFDDPTQMIRMKKYDDIGENHRKE